MSGECWGHERRHQVAIWNRVVRAGLSEKETFEWRWDRGGRMSHKERTVSTKALRSKHVWWNQDRGELWLCQRKWEDGDTHSSTFFSPKHFSSPGILYLYIFMYFFICLFHISAYLLFQDVSSVWTGTLFILAHYYIPSC